MSKILLSNGKYFDYDYIENNEVDIRVIAHALSNICRFGGHSKFNYNVADHSLKVEACVRFIEKRPDLSLEALLHDSSEAFMADLPRPLKMKFENYQELEIRVERHIAKTFGLSFVGKWDSVIKKADTKMLISERNVLFDPPYEDVWPDETPYDEYNPLIFKIRDHFTAESDFLWRFEWLMKERYERVEEISNGKI